MIEPSNERESLSAPGFTLVTSAREDSLPLSGDDVLSMAMTGVAAAPATVAPSLTETAAAEQQWPWMQRRPVRLVATRNVAQAQAVSATPSLAKPKPKVVMAAQQQWPWMQRRSRTAVRAPAPTPAAPIFVKAKPKPVVRDAQEQWPWVQRRPVVLVATRTAGY